MRPFLQTTLAFLFTGALAHAANAVDVDFAQMQIGRLKTDRLNLTNARVGGIYYVADLEWDGIAQVFRPADINQQTAAFAGPLRANSTLYSSGPFPTGWLDVDLALASFTTPGVNRISFTDAKAQGQYYSGELVWDGSVLKPGNIRQQPGPFKPLPTAVPNLGPSIGSTTVTVTPASVSLTYASVPNGVQPVTITAQVNPLISSFVYGFVADDGGAMLPGEVKVRSFTDPSRFSADLVFNGALRPGNYKGTARLILCADRACAQSFTVNDGRLAYDITVTESVKIVGATVNGVSISPINNTFGSPAFVKSGDLVAIQSNMPVDWKTQLPIYADFTEVSTTPTTFTGRANYYSNPYGDGSIQVQLTSNTPVFSRATFYVDVKR